MVARPIRGHGVVEHFPPTGPAAGPQSACLLDVEDPIHGADDAAGDGGPRAPPDVVFAAIEEVRRITLRTEPRGAPVPKPTRAAVALGGFPSRLGRRIAPSSAPVRS